LRALGAIPVEFPTIRIVPPANWQHLDAALKRLYTTDASGRSYYDWLVFTSANGVRICCERLRDLGYDLQAMPHVQIATIGPATAAALARYGIPAALIPDQYVAERVAAALIQDAEQRSVPLQGQRILLARAAQARKVLVSQLQEAGAQVDEVAAYSTLSVASDDERGREVLHLLEQQQLDILTFTSSSTVRNFVAWLKSCQQHAAGSALDLVMHSTHPTIACIGPITSQTARELGLHVDIEAKEFTIDGLVEAIVQQKEII
jgi:uroporphyrinogen-III synthase